MKFQFMIFEYRILQKNRNTFCWGKKLNKLCVCTCVALVLLFYTLTSVFTQPNSLLAFELFGWWWRPEMASNSPSAVGITSPSLDPHCSFLSPLQMWSIPQELQFCRYPDSVSVHHSLIYANLTQIHMLLFFMFSITSNIQMPPNKSNILTAAMKKKYSVFVTSPVTGHIVMSG